MWSKGQIEPREIFMFESQPSANLIKQQQHRVAGILIWVIFCFGFLLFLSPLLAENIPLEAVKPGKYEGAKTATHPNWFKESFLDLEEDISDAAEKNKRLVVYFWQEGCPYCSQLWEDNFSQKDIEKKFRENFEIIAINLWGDREVVTVKGNHFTEKAFAEALNIKYTPTLLFFDEKQKVTLRLNGYVPPEDFRLALEYAALRDEQKPNYAAFVAKKRALENPEKPVTKSHLHNEDFFSKAPYNLERGTGKTKKAKQYLAVFFEKTNCKNCDLLHQKTLKNPLTRKLVKQFKSIQLDRFSNTPVITPAGEKTTAKKWADALNITYQPAIVFFDPQGKEVMRIDAQLRSFHVQSVFDYVLSGAYKTQKNFQRYISTRADILREHGVNVDIWAY
jgi:thioredoxin-related protein